LLEQAGLALHDRLAGERPDVAQPQHGRALGDDRDQVAARGVLPGKLGGRRDLQARLGDAGRIRERQVALRDERLGGDDLDLSGPPGTVVVERVVTSDHRLGTLTGFHTSRDGLARAKPAITVTVTFLASN